MGFHIFIFTGQFGDTLGLNGSANDYTSKFNAMVMLIGIMIIQYILMVIIPKIDPKNNYKTFIRPYMAIFNTLFAVLFVINLMTILTGLGYDLLYLI